MFEFGNGYSTARSPKNATDGMRLTDAEGRIVAANAAFCRMFGRSRNEVEGQLLSALYAERLL